jgi:predicted ATPase
MFLKRVQVPDFRALKNVDISFEEQLEPHVFPLGSQNGGGKSTLLQLIFVLLRCSTRPEAEEIFGNLFKRFSIPEGSEKREIATIEIIGNDREEIKLKFFAASKSFVKNEVKSYIAKYSDSTDNKVSNEVKQLQKEITYILSERNVDYIDIVNFQIEGTDYLGKCIQNILLRSNILILLKYSCIEESVNEDAFIICEINVEAVQPDKIKNLRLVLSEISSHVFLAAPSTQIFLFMSPESRKKLLDKYMKERDNTQYTDDLQYMKDTISNFFTYDFLPVNTLISLFEKARDEDFAQVVKTGNYGSSYNELLEKINAVLGEKRINARDDLSGMQFFLGENGSSTEIYPEDLSHGELKRFGICIWLMASKIKNAIVLMDEIELALHPDWQYQIVRDLVDWGPDNQYILATHSYSLCEALTPAHVKEIPPLLLSHA